MLLNNDIQLVFFVQMILNFQKEINVIMYIIEFLKKVNLNHFIWIKSQKDMNFQSLCFCNV
jgi:hypothetical protein